MSNATITIEQLEELANQIETEEQEERTRLRRLIRAYARIIAIREPDQFKRRALEHSDEDGHWDNSYPPKIKYKDKNGPALISVRYGDYDQVATEGGFYHTWRAVDSDPGVYVGRDGAIWGRSHEGEGNFGQFAAYPGECGVCVKLEWDTRSDSETPLDDLREAAGPGDAACDPLTLLR